MKKKIYSFASLLLLAAFSFASFNSNAQGGVYFREGFESGTGWPTSSANAVTIGSPNTYVTVTTANSGTWYSFGGYSTSGGTGSCPTQTGGAYHVRLANQSNFTGYTSADSSYLITPYAVTGIYDLKYYNGRAAKTITVYKTADNNPATTNWVLVTQFIGNAACDLQTVSVNDAAARRLKVVAHSAADSDLDSLVMTSVGVLPSKLGGISLQSTNDNVRVEWSAYNESNVKGYFVQRSIDGVNFTDIGFVNARNASSTTYNFADVSATSGILFYRIRSVDYDGKAMLGNIAKINMAKSKLAGITVINPVKSGRVEMQLNGLNPGTYRVAFNTTGGGVVASKMVNVQGSSVSVTLDLPASVGKGLYMLTVTGTNLQQAKKVMVE